VEIVNATKIRLLSSRIAAGAAKAMNWLDAHGVDYEVLDVIRDDAAYNEMVKLSRAGAGAGD